MISEDKQRIKSRSDEFATSKMEVEDVTKLTLDFAMTAFAVFAPGIGTAISTIYFVSRIFW